MRTKGIYDGTFVYIYQINIWELNIWTNCTNIWGMVLTSVPGLTSETFLFFLPSFPFWLLISPHKWTWVCLLPDRAFPNISAYICHFFILPRRRWADFEAVNCEKFGRAIKEGEPRNKIVININFQILLLTSPPLQLGIQDIISRWEAFPCISCHVHLNKRGTLMPNYLCIRANLMSRLAKDWFNQED